MTKYNSIDEQMSAWGREAQRLPADNEILKQNLLSAVRPIQNQAPIKQSRPFLYRFAVLATATVAILIVMANPRLFKNSSEQGGQTVYESSGEANLGLTYGTATGLGAEDDNLVEKVARTMKSAVLETDTLQLDTREFMDTSYYATINTRDVQKISDQTKTIIRGHFGRIDSISEQPKFARISFSLPKTELDRMILELKNLVPEKMYLETIYADNRLSEKQNIETDTGNAVDELSRLQAERSATIASYDKQLDAAQARIDSLARSLNTNYSLRSATTNTVKLAEIDAEINRLAENRASAERDYRNTKSRESKELTAIDKKIDRQNTQLDNLGEQDNRLMTDVETVTGSINIQWVSCWSILNTYIPIRPVLILMIIASAIYLVFKRRPRPLNLPY